MKTQIINEYPRKWNWHHWQKPSQIDKIFRKEEYQWKGCLNMEVDSQKRSDYLLLIQARLYGWSGSIADRELSSTRCYHSGRVCRCLVSSGYKIAETGLFIFVCIHVITRDLPLCAYRSASLSCNGNRFALRIISSHRCLLVCYCICWWIFNINRHFWSGCRYICGDTKSGN